MKPEDLTTWALDELSPQERQKIEAALKADEQLHADAESTRDFCDFLSKELGSTEDGLTDSQRTSLLPSPDKAKTVAPKHNATPWWRRPGPATLAAAAVVTLMGGLSLMQEGQLSDRALRAQSASAAFQENAALASPPSAVAASDSQAVQEVQKKVWLGHSMAEIGDYDGAVAAYGDVLKVDPYNSAARRGMEQAGRKKSEYFDSARDQQRVRMLGQVNENWEDRVPTDAPRLAKPANGPQGPSANEMSALSLPSGTEAKVVEFDGFVDYGRRISDESEGTAPVGKTRPELNLNQLSMLGESRQDTGEYDINTPTPAQPSAPSTVAGETFPYTAGRDLQESNGLALQAQLPSIASKEAEDLVRLRKEKLSDLRLTEPAPAPPAKPRDESYTPIHENPFMSVSQDPLSTFSIDVDTASYANVRRFLNDGQRPPPDAVRIEELVNYFRYDYEQPEGDAPFSVNVDIAEAPWNPTHRLARIGLMGREILDDRKPGNFVFLVDVSGSMNSADKLELVQKSLRLLTRQLSENDRVAIVTYAGNSGLALESTSGADKPKITEAIDRMKSGGSTHGSAGIRLAYEQAASNFIKDGVNRVILCTDGDFNVGISDPDELESVIAQKAKSGVFLSVLGFGTGNLKDRTMETLADKGNGNYAYIDSLSEARKVLVEQMNATLVTIAKDVKIQVEFNPAQVQSYRLIGYENRMLAKEDFNDDTKDAGEIGAGHTVTALYELVPVGVALPDGRPIVDALKYQVPAAPAAKPAAAPTSSETLTVKLRHKQPDGEKSQLMEVPVTDEEKTMNASPKDFQFASAVAGFGLLLRNSAHSGQLTWDMVRKLAQKGKGHDKLGYRGEFLQLIDKAQGATER